VLVAAEQAFASSGQKAQLDDIARMAGVGVGTVCRHFPTKPDLLAAVFVRLYESLLERAREALDASNPADGFERFVYALVDFQARHRAFAEQMANELDLTSMPVRDSVMRAVNELVTRAQAAGAIRADIGPADVSMLLSGVAHATSMVGDFQPVLRERYIRIVLDGLRPHEASPLPGRPLSFTQLRRMKQKSRDAQAT
jgi:AcrR family transcriptional regulator